MQEPPLPRELEDLIFKSLESRVLMSRIQLVCKSWQHRAHVLLKQRLVEALTGCGFCPPKEEGDQESGEGEWNTNQQYEDSPTRGFKISLRTTPAIPKEARIKIKQKGSDYDLDETLHLKTLHQMHHWKWTFTKKEGTEIMKQRIPSVQELMQLLVLSTDKAQQVTYVWTYHRFAYDSGEDYGWAANYYFPFTDSKTSREWSILHFLDADRNKGQTAIQFTLEYYEYFSAW